MPMEEISPAPVATIKPPTNVAPRREKRLVPIAPRKRPVAAVRVPRQPLPDGKPAVLSAVESKVVALENPAEILKVIRTEAALRRAQRLSGMGDSQRQTIRLLSVCMLFALLAAAIGAMWYLQTSLQGSRRVHRPPTAVSIGTTAPAEPPAPATR